MRRGRLARWIPALGFALTACLPSGSRIDDGFLGRLASSLDLFSNATYSGARWDGAAGVARLDTPTNDGALDASWTPDYANLVAYWKMNGTGGVPTSAFDAEIGLTGCGATAAGNSFATGKLDTGIEIPRNRGVDCAATAVTSIANDLTVMFWFKHSGGTPVIFQLVLDPIVVGTAGWSISRSGTSDSLQLRVDTSGQTNATCVPATLTYFDGGWHHVAYTISSGTMNAYVDGVLARSCAYAHGGGFASNKAVMRLTGLTVDALTGYDEFAVWSSVLAPDEVAAIYDRQSARYAGTVVSEKKERSEGRSWRSLSAATRLPSGKALPSGSEVGAAYSSVATDATNGLVGHWKLDESAGAAFADATANANDGAGVGALATTDCSATTYASDCAAGRGRFFGGANLAGTIGASHYVEIPNSAAVQDVQESASSFSVWYFPRAYPTNVDGTLRDQYHGLLVKEGNPFGLLFDSSGHFLFQYYDGTASPDGVTSSSTYPLGQWYHVVGTFDPAAGEIALYVNGDLAASFSAGGALSVFEYGAATWKIGAAAACPAAACWPAFGVIDEAAIWSRALGAAEVAQLYRRGANRIKLQARTCASASCADEDAATTANQGWMGTDATASAWFSELNNVASPFLRTGAVQTTAPTFLFTDFSSFASALNAKEWFQGRMILESDQGPVSCNYGSGGTPCSPEVRSWTVEPALYLGQ